MSTNDAAVREYLRTHLSPLVTDPNAFAATRPRERPLFTAHIHDHAAAAPASSTKPLFAAAPAPAAPPAIEPFHGAEKYWRRERELLQFLAANQPTRPELPPDEGQQP